MDKYIPPYDITEEMLELTSEIMELLGELKNVNDLEKLPRLRRVSRIKSIHSSLAIENNTLTLKQVTDVIEGKRVLGPENDIIAVKNAFEVYKTLEEINPFSIFPEAKTVIMLGKRICRGSLRGIEEGTNFGDYQLFGKNWLEDEFLSLACYNLTNVKKEQIEL